MAHECARKKERAMREGISNIVAEKNIKVACWFTAYNSRVMLRPEAGLGLGRFSLIRPAAHCPITSVAVHSLRSGGVMSAIGQRHVTANVSVNKFERMKLIAAAEEKSKRE